eukprot:s941_g2.t1
MAARPIILCLNALGWFLADSVTETAGVSACPGKSSVAVVGDDASLSFLQTSLHLLSSPARPHARQLAEVLPAANVRRVDSALISFRALAIEEHPWWTMLVSMPLLILACLLVHRGLFRPFNWLWLLAPPFSLVGIGLLASQGEGGSVDWPVAAEAAGLTLLLTFMVLVRHAHTPEVSIIPAAGWPPPGSHGLLSSIRKANRSLHTYCEHKLKEATWVYMLAYLGLGASVLVIVIQDLLEQRYANAIAGVFLTLSMPVPNRLLYKAHQALSTPRIFNIDQSSIWEVQKHDAASAREVNDGSDAVDEWCPKHVSDEEKKDDGTTCDKGPLLRLLLSTSLVLGPSVFLLVPMFRIQRLYQQRCSSSSAAAGFPSRFVCLAAQPATEGSGPRPLADSAVGTITAGCHVDLPHVRGLLC